MVDRRRNRKRKEQIEISEDDGKPAEEEYAIAKFMRQKLPEKKTMLLGHKVDYFIACRAIDCLLDSPWATKGGKQEPIFTTRESVVKFMDRMLRHKFFHRARKIIVQKDPKKIKKEKDDGAESSKEKEPKDKKKEPEVKEETDEKGESKKVTDVPKGDKEEKKKEKRKIKLDMHMEQLVIDANEPYVWIYDPIPMRTWIIGMLMVVGAVLVCLFPLWPQSIRHYIYYLSVAAAFFLVFIIGLAVVRVIVFVLIWALTIGKHHLWLLPNLTEDLGFFESFWPLYKYEYKGTKGKEDKEESKKEEESKKDEDKESSSKEIKEKESTEKSDSSSDQEKKNDEDQEHSESEQDSDVDKENTETGDNGFEILDPEDVTQHSKEN